MIIFYQNQCVCLCTRIEHVTHVSAFAETIAKFLNLDLVRSIAMGHDIGHAPFGHEGEYILRDIAKGCNLGEFWHERNSLHFIDKIETLPDYNGVHRNLDLTYAVRDGIVCHCGEIDERYIKPRSEFIDLYTIQKGGKTPSLLRNFADTIIYIITLKNYEQIIDRF